jgi:mono/diheme cytochrome c family protein
MRSAIAIAVLLTVALLAEAATAADERPASPAPAMKREIIPGSRLMTSAERERYRQRIEKLHAECVGCHGTELYEPALRKVKDPGELKKAVEQWNDIMNPRFTAPEVDDLVAYLNQAYYKFQ